MFLKSLVCIFLLVLVCVVTAAYYLGSPRYYGPASDHFNGRKFVNPDGRAKKGFLAFLKWQLSSKRKAWPNEVSWGNSVTPLKPMSGEVVVTFINHSSLLLQDSSATILVDPVFSERVSPFSWVGPRRVHAPGVDLEALTNVSSVLVSHDHYDHLDLPSLEKLAKNYETSFITGLGNGYWMSKVGARKIYELDWWQEQNIGEAKVTFVPAHHWSGRSLGDRRNTLWGGFVIELGKVKIYVAGDSGYSSWFKTINKRLGPFDLCVLPIGAYEPQWFMKDNHLNPEEAVRVHKELGCTRSLAVHFGTFRVSDENWDDPMISLASEREKAGISQDAFKILVPGESLRLRDSKNIN